MNITNPTTLMPVQLMAGIALVVAIAPTLTTLFEQIWPQQQYSHGMLIPFVFVWLVWRQRSLLHKRAITPSYTLASIALISGSILLSIGRVSTVITIETMAIPLLVGGVILLLYGRETSQHLRFPILFLLLLVPLPGIVMYTLTAGLKEWNAIQVVELLYMLGYPIALDGVVIVMGGYQLYLADACAGVNSLFALLSLGILFVYLLPSRSTLRKSVLACIIIPVAIMSNLLRVLIILLLTYHANDHVADQLHNLIGYGVFIGSLYLLLLLDRRFL